MRRRDLLKSAAAVAAGLLPGTVQAAGARRRPNFIVVLCDDLGYGDIQPYGNGLFPTPNLMRMAREGTTFTDYYAPAAVCTPSRAGLLTGRYPIRTGLGKGVILANDHRGLPLEEVTIPEALGAGYASALIGKWHLGHFAPSWPPTRHGFEYFFGLPYSHDIHPLALFEAKGEAVQTLETEPDVSTLQQKFWAQAEAFIEANQNRPFFLELALSAPHLPERPRPPFQGATVVGPYGDVVSEIDWIMGQLLDKLRALHLEEDTLVVFTSDNGPWFEGSTGGLRDRKYNGAGDGASRVPFIAWRPGVVPAGRTSDSLISGMDLLPTFCAMAGVAAPKGVQLDGRDITPELLGRGAAADRTLLLFNDDDIWGLRTQRWKLVVRTYNHGFAVPLDKMGYAQLFDTRLEPSESYNVAALHPEVMRDLTTRLQSAEAAFAPLKQRRAAPGAAASVHD